MSSTCRRLSLLSILSENGGHEGDEGVSKQGCGEGERHIEAESNTPLLSMGEVL